MAPWRAEESERRGTASRLLVVGLANPGAEFEHTRHNVGGDAVREVARRRGVELKFERRLRAAVGTLATPEGPVTLAVPTTYMNESGASVKPLVRRAAIADLGALVVVHDELDLDPGSVRVKLGGGLAGHNGLRSIAQVLGSREFARIRVGIGKPPTKDRGADWVLQRLSGARRAALAVDVERAADAVEAVIDLGFADAQQRVNAS
ncbi:MAG: aminoacyl-tRNA hydrolase [Acidimicrobiales bacterium]